MSRVLKVIRLFKPKRYGLRIVFHSEKNCIPKKSGRKRGKYFAMRPMKPGKGKYMIKF
jgi:hypothetical protein